MKRFLTHLALLVLSAGLPLQNLHAVAMPGCEPAKETTATHDPSVSDNEISDHDHDGHTHATSDVNTACDGCGQCHACSAPAIASLAFAMSIDAADSPPVVRSSHISLFNPEQPQRPPLQS